MKIIIGLLVITFTLNAMDTETRKKGENWISEEIIYTDHALEKMVERSVTVKEIMKVLKEGYRGVLDSDNGTRRFTERKNKSNPLVVVLKVNVDPNIVITLYREDLISKTAAKKEFSNKRNMAYLKKQKDKKIKDLIRQ